MIFLAGLGLDAAGNIDSIGTHNANGLSDVLHLEAARKNNTVRGGGAAGQVPIRGLAGAAILAGACGIEQEREDAGVAIKHSQREFGVDAKGLDDRERTSYARNNVRTLVTVKLCRVEAHKCTQRVDFRGSGVHKDADRFNFFRKFGAYLRRVGGNDTAKALLVKIETQGVGPGIGGSFGVGQIGDAADLDADHNGGPSGAVPRRVASAAAGSGASIRCSPIRNASKPAWRRRSKSSWVRRPDSLTAIQWSGIWSISSREVSARIVKVFRSRLFTPRIRASAASARSSSALV